MELESEKQTVASLEDFKKLDLRVGVIRAAERVPDSDKLLKLSVDLGEPELRQIVAGIAPFVEEPGALAGKQCVFVANMAPRRLRGVESNGMLLAAGAGDGFAFIIPETPLPPGTALR